MKNKMIYFVLAILVIFTFVGCSADTTASKDVQQTREIIDLKGRKVTIPKEVNKVISSYMPATNLVFIVGGEKKLVGVSDKGKKNPFFKSLYPEIDELVEVGSKSKGLNIETVVAMKPDVIIMFPNKQSENTCKQLKEQGIPAVVIDLENIDNMKKSTLLMGEVLGRKEQAIDVIKYYEDTMIMIEERLKKIPIQDRKKVYLAAYQARIAQNKKPTKEVTILNQICIFGEICSNTKSKVIWRSSFSTWPTEIQIMRIKR